MSARITSPVTGTSATSSSSSSPTSSSIATASYYIISPDQKAKYDAQFKRLCPPGEHYISGAQAKGLMLQSGLEPVVLANIWALSDVDADGRMDINEFSIALHLIALKLKGIEVPRTLPQSLRVLVEPPPAFAAFNDVGSNKSLSNNTSGNTPRVARAGSLANTSSIISNSSTGGFGASQRMNSMGNISSAMGVTPTPISSAAAVASGEWAVSQQCKLKYTQLFNTHDRQRTGFLTGGQARSILLESKLPQQKLAQIWNLADVDADGKLTCEEFVLAMHLIDRVRNNEALPLKLPPNLVPPSYRRGGGGGAGGVGGVGVPVPTGTLSHGSSLDDGTTTTGGADSPILHSADLNNSIGSLGKSSFEDKRRENFEKGQAELDRRRAALMEQQKREREERERKEREEAERKEKERLELERRKAEEHERQQQRLREQELEREEQKRRAAEVRELARKEMERQRQRELEQVRRNELITARGRIQEEVQRLKSRKKSLKIEHEQVEKRITDAKVQAQLSRDKVVKVKSEIDGMRVRRDEILSKQTAIKTQMKSLTEKQLFIEQEKVRLAALLKTLFANATTTTDQSQLTSFDSMLQAKRLAINQLRAHYERYEAEAKQKKEDVLNAKRELQDWKRKIESKIAQARTYADLIETKRVEAERVRDGGVAGGGGGTRVTKQLSNALSIDAGGGGEVVWGQEVPSNFAWPTTDQQSSATAASAAAVTATPIANVSEQQPSSLTSTTSTTTTQTKFKYRCLYEFEARNPDEISIKPGDIIMVDTSAASEPDWLSGEINGKVGWFPQGYAELIDENGDSVNAKKNDSFADAFAATVSAAAATANAAAASTRAKASTDVPSSLAGAGASAVSGSGGQEVLKKVRALYDYASTDDGHLSFVKDDLIQISAQQDAWYFGELLQKTSTGTLIATDHSGWFPESFVMPLDDDATTTSTTSNAISTTAAKTTSGGSAPAAASNYYVALFAFESMEPGDLGFESNELICVEIKDGDWWTGTIVDRTTGVLDRTRKGIFPSNFVGPATDADIPFLLSKPTSTVSSGGASAGAGTGGGTTTTTTTHQPLNRKESETGSELGDLKLSTGGKKKSKQKKSEIYVAVSNYTASSSEQISFETNAMILVRKKTDTGWWEGEVQQKGKKKQSGWFPASYVKPFGSGGGGGGGGGGASSGAASTTTRSTPDSYLNEPEIERVEALYSFKAEREDEISIDVNDIIRVLSKPDPTWWRGHNIRTGAVGLFPSNHVNVLPQSAATNSSTNVPTNGSSSAAPATTATNNSNNNEYDFTSSASQSSSLFHNTAITTTATTITNYYDQVPDEEYQYQSSTAQPLSSSSYLFSSPPSSSSFSSTSQYNNQQQMKKFSNIITTTNTTSTLGNTNINTNHDTQGLHFSSSSFSPSSSSSLSSNINTNNNKNMNNNNNNKNNQNQNNSSDYCYDDSFDDDDDEEEEDQEQQQKEKMKNFNVTSNKNNNNSSRQQQQLTSNTLQNGNNGTISYNHHHHNFQALPKQQRQELLQQQQQPTSLPIVIVNQISPRTTHQQQNQHQQSIPPQPQPSSSSYTFDNYSDDSFESDTDSDDFDDSTTTNTTTTGAISSGGIVTNNNNTLTRITGGEQDSLSINSGSSGSGNFVSSTSSNRLNVSSSSSSALGAAAAATQYQQSNRSPQLYTVRIMDLVGKNDQQKRRNNRRDQQQQRHQQHKSLDVSSLYRTTTANSSGNNSPTNSINSITNNNNNLSKLNYRSTSFIDLSNLSTLSTSATTTTTTATMIDQQRLNIIYELITTEEVYIKDIYFTLENFKRPLMECGKFPMEMMESFFCNIDEIYQVNYQFYNDLIGRLQENFGGGSDGGSTSTHGGSSNNNNIRVSDILLQSLQSMLPVYKRFCSGQMASSRQLQLKLESDTTFAQTLQQIAQQNNCHLPLSSYLLKPMQRITKYPLLIEKLHDATPSTHVDYADCGQVLAFAKSFCKQINEACRDTENFEKLHWLQKHVQFPMKDMDHVIDFNSETQFLGPRTLLHSGILIKASSSKMLAVFLFNDFLLLTYPNKKIPKNLGGTNFFYNQKALDTTYTLYRKPIILNDVGLADLPEFESTLDPGLFRLFIRSQKRYLSLRAGSANECMLWMKQIEAASQNYHTIQRLRNEHQTCSPNTTGVLPAQAPIGTLYLTIIEAVQLYTRNYALNAYCKVMLGTDREKPRLCRQTKTVRLDFTSKSLRRSKFSNSVSTLTNIGVGSSGNGNNGNGNYHHHLGSLTNGTHNANNNYNHHNNTNTYYNTKDGGAYKIVWNENFRFNLYNLETETLYIECYDENPFAPHQCLAEISLPLVDIEQQHRYVIGSVRSDLRLRVPNQGISKNLLHPYPITPSVLVIFDLVRFDAIGKK